VRLDEACSHIVDCEHKTAPVDGYGEFFAVGTPAMRDHRINYDEARRISAETFETWTRRLKPAPGDLLLAREAPVGPVVLLPDSARVAPGQRTVLLRPDPLTTNSTFLYYSLRSPATQAALQVKAEGSTVRHLNVSDIRSFKVRMPPLAEQEAIAEVLGALDDKIAANTALATTAVELARTSYWASVRGPEAVDVRVDSLLQHGAGKYLTKDSYADGGQYVVYGSNSIMGSHSHANTTGPFLVLARIGSNCGSFQWSQRDAWVNNNASALTAIAGIDPYLLRFALDKLDMSAHLAGSGQPFVRIESLLKDVVTIPPTHDAAVLGALIGNVGEFELSLHDENRTLAATRDALLPQLMSGKLRVRDAEVIASDAGA